MEMVIASLVTLVFLIMNLVTKSHDLKRTIPPSVQGYFNQRVVDFRLWMLFRLVSFCVR